MASPFYYDPKFPHYWSKHLRDKVFGANTNAQEILPTFWVLHLPSHLPWKHHALSNKTRHPLCCCQHRGNSHSHAPPSWNKNMTTNPYASLCHKYPHMCKSLGTIPSNQLQYAKVPFWNNIQIPLSKHTWEFKIIAIWNTKGRVCLNAYNKDWLKELAKKSLRQSGKFKTCITIPAKQP